MSELSNLMHKYLTLYASLGEVEVNSAHLLKKLQVTIKCKPNFEKMTPLIQNFNEKYTCIQKDCSRGKNKVKMTLCPRVLNVNDASHVN